MWPSIFNQSSDVLFCESEGVYIVNTLKISSVVLLGDNANPYSGVSDAQVLVLLPPCGPSCPFSRAKGVCPLEVFYPAGVVRSVAGECRK